MPTTPRVFNCGEFKPFRYFPLPVPGGGAGSIVIYGPTGPVDPWVPQPSERWVCVCKSEITPLGGCTERASRECVRIENAGSYPRSDQVYASKAACESGAFDERPCQLSLFQCVENQQSCTPPLYGTIVNRRCVELPPVRERPTPFPPNIYDTLGRCNLSCNTVNNCVSKPDPFKPEISNPAGTERPRQGYKCVVYTSQSCPDNNSVQISIRRCVPCVYDGSDPECIYNTESTCTQACQNDSCRYKCVEYTRECPLPPLQVTGTICQQCKYDPYDPTTASCNKQQGCNGSCFEARCTDITVTSVGSVGVYTPPRPVDTGIVLNDPYLVRYKGVVERGIPSCRQCTQTEIYNLNGATTCRYTSLQQCIELFLMVSNQPFDPVNPLNLTGVDATVEVDLGLNQQNSISKELFVADKNKDTNIYNPVYNFFSYQPNTKTYYVVNPYYLSIFNKYVSNEVYTVLSRNAKQEIYWNEKLFSDITNAKIAISLNVDLLKAINSLHGVDNTLISPENIFAAIKQLLLQNRLNEFDPNFYINLSNKQKNDPKVVYKYNSSKDVLERAGLGILSEGSIPADANQHTDENKFRLFRQKRLNTDINTRLKVTTDQDYEIPYHDAGLAIYQTDASTLETFIPMGTGDGYFLPYYNEEEVIKIPLNTEIARALYVPQNVRYAALKAFRETPDIIFNVSSLENQHEFIPSYELTSVLSPMYFALDLSSIEDLPKSNPLVDRIKAKYRLLTNEEEIQSHVYNYGFSVVRLNLDYRDPFAHYAKETGIFDLTQNDITFRYFNINLSGTLNDSSILTRSLPFGIVVIPGCGSKHNPYHGKSKISKINNTFVERSFIGQASIDFSNYYSYESDVLSSISTESLEINLPEDHYGYANKFYYVYNPTMYINTYFNKIYQSTEPTNLNKSKPVTSYLVNNIIDNLIIGYNPLELKWFDVYSRLKAQEVAELLYEGTKDFYNLLEGGWRSVNIKPLLRSEKDRVTYIDSTIIPEVEVPQPIINKDNRFNGITS